jgi:hypothetical protein
MDFRPPSAPGDPESLPDRSGRIVRALLVVAALLMAAGHVAIDGMVFDPINGETYNLYSRWVSDYAGRPGEGVWIKASIAVFAGALALLYRTFSARFATGWRGVLIALAFQVLAAGMVGGLVLVAIFDISPRQFEVVEDLERLGRAGRDEPPRPDAGDAAGTDETGEDPALVALLTGDGVSLREEIFREVLLADDEDDALMTELHRLRHDPAAMRQAIQSWRRDRARTQSEAAEASPTLRRLPLRPRQRVKERYHRLGFRLFLVAFVAAAIATIGYEARHRQHHRLPGSLLLLLLAAAFGSWLFIEHLGLAGIPQRALMVVIGVWAWRHTSHVAARPRGPPGDPVPA